MRKTSILTMFLFVGLVAFSQKSKTLLTIDDKAISVAEFQRIYEKNLDIIKDKKSKNIDTYLDLFINFKLKVKEAKRLKMDTLPSYKREINTYKNQLAAPYLQDVSFKEKLIREAYFRTENEVRASHILVKMPKNVKPSDTLKYYMKILNARKRIINGESFEKVAKEISEDTSVKINGGDVGYFAAFRMVYPFEDKAYTTKVGEVSMPFKTRFGYHILKPTATRKSLGQVQVAHILITDTTLVGVKKVNSVYAKLKRGEDFSALAKKYSNDNGTKEKGGVLSQFGAGMVDESFSGVAFALKNINDISKPVKTRYGWHILKLLKKIPVLPFEDLRTTIENQIKNDDRIRLSDKAIVNKLKKKYTIKINNDAKQLFLNTTRREFSKDSMQATLLTIQDKKITQEDFSKFIKFRRHIPVENLWNNFIDKEVINYFKANLVHTEPDYRYTLQEYEEGLLLFELMQQKVWGKSVKDTIGLQTFFKENKTKYSAKLAKIKGEVINDYQQELEQKLLANIRKRSKININKKQLKKFKKAYHQ